MGRKDLFDSVQERQEKRGGGREADNLSIKLRAAPHSGQMIALTHYDRQFCIVSMENQNKT